MNKKAIITILLASIAIAGQGADLKWKIEGTFLQERASKMLIIMNKMYFPFDIV